MEKDNLEERNMLLEKELDELKEKYEKEVKKRKENIKIYHKREEKSRRIMITTASFASILGIAVGAVLSSLHGYFEKIHTGANEIAKYVQDECFYDIGYHDTSSGYTFNVGETSVSYDSAMNTIKFRAQANGISDIDLYIGVSKIISPNAAKSVVEDIDRDDINQRCMEVYLEHELESVNAYGK